MLLSKINEQNFEILKDADFDQVGMATTIYKNERVLSFLEDSKFLDSILDNPNIVAIVTTKEIYEQNVISKDYGIIFSTNPKLLFYEIHNKLIDMSFYQRKADNKISTSSEVSNNAFLADYNIQIGDNCIVEPGVVIYPNTKIGDNVIIRAGSTIGSEGFQFLNEGESVIAAKSAGGVVIESNVEIQNNTCVDRGVFGGNTIIKQNAKIDNLVHIAHDAIIGKRTMIAAGSAIGGRTVIGSDSWIGINATISNGLTLGDNCKISLGAVVTQDVPSGKTVTGNFAIDHKKFIEFIKSIR
ncbi:MAG TPA: UDP-3-O-(3-hydroxymyristoyl)glucosamine N-acyltransferase [Candidatus Eisenbacteria bacterium]|nr:UDP-3-O-(3-hydroxymyristoyl)glucosamine N-acyltransferase [Candidatus Eisenbacteria bacterium]